MSASRVTDMEKAKDETLFAPYITIDGIGVTKYLDPEGQSRLSRKLSENSKAERPFEVFNQTVSMLDDGNRKLYEKETSLTRLKMLGTIEDLLQFAKHNATLDRGVILSFVEVAKWTGYKLLDDKGIGHQWAGMLVKKKGAMGSTREEWCFNIYCITTPFVNPAEYIGIFRGRTKLWCALKDAGINVTEVNTSAVYITLLKDTCMINTMYWLYMASNENGGLWEDQDSRKASLRLNLLSKGQDLPSSIQATSPLED